MALPSHERGWLLSLSSDPLGMFQRTALRPFWCIALCVVIYASSSQSSDVLNCDDYNILCVHGICKNNTLTGVVSCICDRGWTGASCQHCFGRRSISDSSGYITDGPGNYSIDTKCTWLIEAPHEDTPIRLRFEHFSTECSWDHVYVYDGSSVYDPTLAVVSGLIMPEWKPNQSLPEINALSGSAYIHFYSDAAYSMNGFNISYVVGSCPLDCSGHGQCQSSGRCDCEPGWRGDGCDIAMCPSDCNAWGVCKGTDDSMYCDCTGSSFRGVDCSIPDRKGVWKEVQQMPSDNVPHARASHASLILTEDGKHYMYIVSGYDFDNPVNLDLIRYNFKQGFWEQMLLNSGVEPVQRYGHAVSGHDDKIFMYGGIIDTSVTDEVWMFDTTKREWQQMINISMHVASERANRIAVVGHSAHIVNGVMYIIFGHSPIFGYINHVQKYHIDSNTWEVTTGTGALVKGGYGHSSVYDPSSDLIFVHAGYYSTSASAYSLTDTLYAYSVNEGSWQILPSSGQYKYLHSAVILNNLMLVFGGNTHNDTLHSQGAKCFSTNFMVYDIACQEWYNLDKPLLPQNVARFGHIAEVYDGKMFIFGGFNGKVLFDMYHYEAGICTSHEDQEACLSSREGVKCVWVNDDRCEYPAVADDQLAHKNIQLIDGPKCDSRLYDLSSMCRTYHTCPSCVANDFNCAWCNSKCLRQSDCEDRENASNEQQCLTSFKEGSQSCSNHHNCYSCYEDPACYWKSSENSCEVSVGREHRGATEEHCESPCFTHESCENCTLASCMWCSSQKQCVESNSYVPSFPYGQCMEWTTMKSKCPATRCEELRSCHECQNLPSCGWCNDGSDNGLGTCMDGSRDGPMALNATLQPDLCQHSWYFVQCPLCQCNGHSHCEKDSDVCVECLNETMGDQCQYCKDGFWGVATNGGHCQACQCYDQADSCQRDTGSCYCHTRGVKGDQCDTCDEANEYYGDPKAGGTCYYKLATDFAFTFNLSKEENRHITRINFMNVPSNEDRDVDFSISCSGTAYLNISIKEDNALTEALLHSEECNYLKYKFKHSDFKFGSRYNTTFYVYIYDFNTPFRLQVSFSQYTQIDLVHFFVTFFSCFLSLLLIAAMFWKVKQKYDLYRRRQRLVVQMEQMASRPFAACNLEIEPVGASSAVFQTEPPDLRRSARSRRKQSGQAKPSPVALEPLSRQKAAILTLVIRLPTGDEAVTPSGQSGIALASTLVTLGNPRKSSSDHQKGDKASTKTRKPAAGLGNCV